MCVYHMRFNMMYMHGKECNSNGWVRQHLMRASIRGQLFGLCRDLPIPEVHGVESCMLVFC
jgi:hypothetical protein